MAAPDLSSAITQGAADPAAFSSDGQSGTSKPLADLIAADKYLRATYGADQKHRGLRFTRLIGPAQVGPCSCR